jgi:hypothetical protein
MQKHLTARESPFVLLAALACSYACGSEDEPGPTGPVQGGSGGSSAAGTSSGSNAGGGGGTDGGGRGGSAGAGVGGSGMGGSGGSGASSGSGGSGAPTAGNGTCGADALFCEDFEDLAVGAVANNAGFEIDNGGATLSIDGTVAQGSRSLHIASTGSAFGFIRTTFNPPGNSFFGRVRLRVQSFPTAPNYAHFILVEATGTGSNGLVRPVGGQFIEGQGETALWGVGNDRGSSGDWTSWQPSAPAVSGEWICYEWQMRAADNNIDVWLDGVAQPALSVSSTMRRDYNNGPAFAFPTFQSIRFGWWLFQPNDGMRDVWLDDIAIAPTRIGCGG